MPREAYEFHCTVSGGGCGGYIMFATDLDHDTRIIMKCPKCGHEHARLTNALNGNARHSEQESATVRLIEPTMAAWSAKSRLAPVQARGPLGDAWARLAGKES